MLSLEKQARRLGHLAIAGVDEAGRGPLAGPVVAGAVTLREGAVIKGLTDSKQLTEKKRNELYDIIIESAVSFCVAHVSHEVIDQINILQATLRAMCKAVEGLDPEPDFVLIDGMQTILNWPGPQKAVVKGDTLSLSIAAASVLAKVARDKVMVEYSRQYPEYGFDRHKGYGSAYHRDAIAKHGPCPIHRKTFRGVREFTEGFIATNKLNNKEESPQLELIK
ncbi:Ribonuclease HII [hydrothermal vent metagenome]|uniref:Ribonuclease HII n=1 Tax=hydrothermal vent metagenome TaxID=652676 RepID=A0A3B1CLP8_9ZZZZ